MFTPICFLELLEDTIIPKLRNEFYVMSCKEKITTDIYIVRFLNISKSSKYQF